MSLYKTGPVPHPDGVKTLSGTSVDWPNIPAWARRIVISFAGASLSGASNILVQIGDSGGIENTGYISYSGNVVAGPSVGVISSAAGFVITLGSAARIFHGSMILSLMDAATNLWAASFAGAVATDSAAFGGGSKALTAVLDRVRLTTVNGTDTYDAGSAALSYE